MDILYNMDCISEPTAVALGYFDGIHRGHLDVISDTVNFSQNGVNPVVFTFQKSPRSVLFGSQIKGIITCEKRNEILSDIGVKRLYCIDFSLISDYSAQKFVEKILYHKLNAKHISCGFNYHFGKGGKCGCKTLIGLCSDYGISVNVIHPVMYGEKIVSSTEIRGLIAKGDVSNARNMLGRFYNIVSSFKKKVINQLGGCTLFTYHKLDDELVYPPCGVYSSLINLHNMNLKGVTKIVRKVDYISLETYFSLDIKLPIYKDKIEVNLVQLLNL